MNGLLSDADHTTARYEVVAISDAYGPRREAVKARPNGQAASVHLDYREVLQQNIDAVIIASPDHWHVRMAIDASLRVKTSISKSRSLTPSMKA